MRHHAAAQVPETIPAFLAPGERPMREKAILRSRAGPCAAPMKPHPREKCTYLYFVRFEAISLGEKLVCRPSSFRAKQAEAPSNSGLSFPSEWGPCWESLQAWSDKQVFCIYASTFDSLTAGVVCCVERISRA